MELKATDLGIVHGAVVDAQEKWYQIGLQLGVHPSSLNSIRTDRHSNSEKLCETVEVWLKTAPGKPTWHDIVVALRSRAVGESRIAADVEAKFCRTTAETGGQASGQMMAEDTQLSDLQQARNKIQKLEQKVHDCERENQQLAQQREEQKRREAKAQQEKQWLQEKINKLEKEKEEACEKIEAGEKQIRQLKKLVGEHEEIKMRLEKQIQQYQDEAEKYQCTIDMLKKTEENVPQLKCTIDEQDRKLYKLESRLEEEIKHKKQLQEELQAMKQSAVIPRKTIQDMSWHKESNAPDGMSRGSAASGSRMAYFNDADSTKVYSYNSDTKEWSRLPDTPYARSTLVVVQGMPTMVGGKVRHASTDSLLSIIGQEGRDKKWQPHYPPMPTKRFCTAAICSGHSLIVAGGNGGQGKLLDTVEVLDTDTQQWCIASSLISSIINGTISICSERLYINDFWTCSAFTCSIPELLESCQPLSSTEKILPAKQSKIWQHIAAPLYTKSSLASLCGQLIAVGGHKHNADTATVAVYDEKTDSWETMGEMPTARHNTLVAIVNEKLMVVGGNVGSSITNVVHMLY